MGTHILLFLIARGIHEIRESRLQGEVHIVEPKVHFLIFETLNFLKKIIIIFIAFDNQHKSEFYHNSFNVSDFNSQKSSDLAPVRH